MGALMLSKGFQTLLILDEIGVPLYSARGLTQTLGPIAGASSARRTINGQLEDISYSQFKKYVSKVSCTDQRSPPEVWPGLVVTVHCVAMLAYPVSGSPQRPAISGSEITEGAFVHYRPILSMMVTSVTRSFDEWGAGYQWELDLEEV
jgi:hypothetical protein